MGGGGAGSVGGPETVAALKKMTGETSDTFKAWELRRAAHTPQSPVLQNKGRGVLATPPSTLVWLLHITLQLCNASTLTLANTYFKEQDTQLHLHTRCVCITSSAPCWEL